MIKKYYEKIVEQLLLKAQSYCPTFALFKTDRSDVLFRFLHEYCDLKEDIIFVSTTHKKRFYEPYFPLLGIIKKKYNSYSKKELFNIFSELDIFYTHVNLLISFIKEEKITRKEDILEDEVEYEKRKIYESITKVFLNIYNDKTVVLVIENLSDLPPSSLSLLASIYSTTLKAKVFISVLLDRDDLLHNSSEILSFLKLAENNVVCIDIFFNEPKVYPVNNTFQENQFDNYDNLLNLLSNCYYLLAYEDCKKVIDEIERRYFQNSQNSLSPAEILNFHILRGDVYSMLNDNDVALLNYSIALDLSINKNDKQLVALSNLKLSYCSFKKNDYETSAKYAQLSVQIAEEIGDEELIMKGYLNFFISEDRTRNIDMNKWMTVFKRLIALAEKLGMTSTLIYCYTNPFGMYSNYTDEIKAYHIKGIKLAKKLKDIYRLARAYQTMGMAYAVQGNYNNVFKYYNKARYYYRKLNDVKGISYIYNGMGFYFYLTGNYQESIVCYFKALKYIRKYNDYHEVSMTLFNMSLCYFMGFEDALSLKYLDSMFEIMRIMEYKNLSYHSEFGLKAVYGVVSALNGDLVRAYQSTAIIKANRLKPFPQKNEEFFMYEMLLALLSKHEKNSRKSLFHFKKAYYYLERNNDVITYFTPRYYFELSLLYQQFNDVDEYRKSLEKGLQYANDTDNHLYKILFSKKLDKITEEYIFKLPDHGFDLEYWIQSARLENNLIMLHKRIGEINLLNRIQEYYVSSFSTEEVIHQVIRVLNDSLHCDSIIYYKKTLSSWQEEFSNIGNQLGVEKILDEIIHQCSGQVIYARSNNFKELNVFTSYIVEPVTVLNNFTGCFIFGTEKHSLGMLGQNDLKIITIIMKQLSIALERKIWEAEILEKNKQLEIYNEKLLISSTTDKLTGLYNRQALYKKITDEEQKNNNISLFSVLFIDLDNFKYYNDTFGHNIGDELLIFISQIIKKAVREVDFAARYGGDEFVILLPDTNEQLAVRVGERIVSEVREVDIDSLLKNDMLEIKIPENKRISASIGVAICQQSDDINSLILKADKALYNAKKLGKGRVAVYKS